MHQFGTNKAAFNMANTAPDDHPIIQLLQSDRSDLNITITQKP